MKTVVVLFAVCFVCSTAAIAQTVSPETELRQARQTIQELRQQIAGKDAEIKRLEQRLLPRMAPPNGAQYLTGGSQPLMIGPPARKP